MNMSKQEIFEQLQEILNELFEIEPSDVTMESTLYEDLDLDSIDAVDLIVHLQKITNKKFKPEEFRSVKFVSDVVDIIAKELGSQ